MRLLHMKDKKLLCQQNIVHHVHPFLDKQSGKPRLIEAPDDQIKAIQKELKGLLSTIAVPDNVFSGIKGKSYIDNARLHSGYVFKIDLTAFFPSISRDKVYSFFQNDLKCSPDVAEALSNLTTIDLSLVKNEPVEEIYSFLSTKKAACNNHLISGSPSSQILSYLVNRAMFDEMQKLADKLSTRMSIYVDDITFSCDHKIPDYFKHSVLRIVKKNGYAISISKVKSYKKMRPS